MISDEAFDAMREAWQSSIPPQYRARPEGREWRGGAGIQPGAIIGPTPSQCTLQKFFDSIEPHLTEPQRREKEKREAAAQKAIEKRRRNSMIAALGEL